MKIGIISTVSAKSWSGSEEMWKLFSLEALRHGHSVAIAAQPGIAENLELAEFRRLGGIAFTYQPLTWIMRRITTKGLYSRFGKILSWNPDLLCISAGGPADFYWEHDLMTVLRDFKGPQVYILQANAEGLIQGDKPRQALRDLYLKASRIICVSESNARLLQHQLSVSLPSIKILPNPIRTRVQTPLPWPEENDGAFRFATVARYEVNSKCQDQTLEALSLPHWKARNWHLSLFGKGPDEFYLKSLIRYYGLEGRVTIRGYLRDFREIWSDHHLHILNSRIEGLTLALIESMFCGRPAVITRAGGNHEVLRDNVDGFVCPGSCAEAIGATLDAAWSKRTLWQTMGQAAFKRANEWIPADLEKLLLREIIGGGAGLLER